MVSSDKRQVLNGKLREVDPMIVEEPELYFIIREPAKSLFVCMGIERYPAPEDFLHEDTELLVFG
jgi:hypothetical protein